MENTESGAASKVSELPWLSRLRGSTMKPPTTGKQTPVVLFMFIFSKSCLSLGLPWRELLWLKHARPLFYFVFVLSDQTLVFPVLVTFCNACVVLCLQHQPLPDAHPAGELPLCSEVLQKPGKVTHKTKLWRHHVAQPRRIVLNGDCRPSALLRNATRTTSWGWPPTCLPSGETSWSWSSGRCSSWT